MRSALPVTLQLEAFLSFFAFFTEIHLSLKGVLGRVVGERSQWQGKLKLAEFQYPDSLNTWT